MSATVNANQFIDYFETFNCAHINIPGRTFPVQSFYLDLIVQNTQYELDSKSPYATKDFKAKQKGGNKGGGGKKGGKSVSRFKAKKMAIDQSRQDTEDASTRVVRTIEDDEGGELGITEQTVKTILGMDPDLINYDLLAELVVHLLESGKHKSGSMLIFVSGSGEIDKAIQAIDKLFNGRKAAARYESEYTLDSEEGGSRAERREAKQSVDLMAKKSLMLLPLHSQMDSKAQRLVFTHPRDKHCTKVVVSTNIAETSLTIDDCTCVIDSGRHKEMTYDPSQFMSVLAETYVSRANASQRSGRAGRVMPGKCYRLYTKKRFEQVFKAQPTPEMLSVPLESVVLKIKVLQLGDVREFLNRAIEPPSSENIDHVLESLQELQAIFKDDTQEELTSLGYHLANLPVDPKVCGVQKCVCVCVFVFYSLITSSHANTNTHTPTHSSAK
jgi:ATP-dependent RNA helicase DHX29